jgi:nitrate reductase gamma subunit
MNTALRMSAFTLQMSGTVILAVMTLMFHQRMTSSKTIADSKIQKFIVVERTLAILALILIIAGFVFLIIDEIYSREEERDPN